MRGAHAPDSCRHCSDEVALDNCCDEQEASGYPLTTCFRCCDCDDCAAVRDRLAKDAA